MAHYEDVTQPIRVLELRSVRGTGGGPDKTILLGTAQTDARRFEITVCYIRDARDGVFAIDAKAKSAHVDYVEVLERHSVDFAIWRQLRTLVRRRSIDIVHAHDYKTDLLALLLARTEGVMPFATVHGWTRRTWRERLVYNPGDKWLLTRFPRVAAVSQDIRNTLIRAGVQPQRIATIPNGINHRVYRRDPCRIASARRDVGVADGHIAIGAIGRLEPEKRFDVLLDAFAVLTRQRSGLQLLVAGEGSERQRLERKARDLKIADRCRFLGHRTEVSGVYHALDVFVQSSDLEGTPNAVLEAMAFETPIVATDAGGTRDLITPGLHGIIVPRREPEAIARAVDTVLGDAETTARRVAAARTRVERELSFDARMAAIEALYSELAAKSRAGALTQHTM